MNVVIVRGGSIQDLEIISEIEEKCFPPAEAASKEKFQKRLEQVPDYFWLAKVENEVVGFINGPVINQLVIDDEMYGNINCHQPKGLWQTVFGINTLLAYRGQGIGGMMLDQVIECAKLEGRKGCILTCKDHLKGFYESHGFQSMGESASTHGGAKWNDMILEF